MVVASEQPAGPARPTEPTPEPNEHTPAKKIEIKINGTARDSMEIFVSPALRPATAPSALPAPQPKFAPAL